MFCKHLVLWFTWCLHLQACTVDHDCFGGGVCLASGQCQCDAAWKGDNCTELNLLPAKTGAAWRRADSSSWGGSVVQDPRNSSVHYMFAADMALHCGLNSWQHNSQISAAVSTSGPEGPFVLKDAAVLGIFSHNPTVHKTLDGHFVIMHIGSGKPERPAYTDCTNGTTPSKPPSEIGIADFVSHRGEDIDYRSDGDLRLSGSPPQIIAPEMLYSASLDGPWKTYKASSGELCNNPGAHFFPNGSVLLVCKVSLIPQGSPWRQMAIYTADDWRGPYVLRSLAPVFGEDAYIWHGPRAFHMLVHSMHPHKVPTTAWSPDGINWFPNGYAGPDKGEPAPRQSFGRTITLESGEVVQLARRERHQVLVDPETREPIALYNGCTLPGKADFSFTSVQRIRRSSDIVTMV